jgi:hypothetical protein
MSLGSLIYSSLNLINHSSAAINLFSAAINQSSAAINRSSAWSILDFVRPLTQHESTKDADGASTDDNNNTLQSQSKCDDKIQEKEVSNSSSCQHDNLSSSYSVSCWLLIYYHFHWRMDW